VRGSGHRRGNKFCESGPFGELRKPAFDMRKRRFNDALDAEPPPRIGTESDVGDRKIVTLDEAAACQVSVDNPPLDGFRIGVLLDSGHVTLLDWGPHQGPKYRTID